MQIIDTIGETPLVEIPTGIEGGKVRLLGKLEGNNPAGSVKDRPARSMILSGCALSLTSTHIWARRDTKLQNLVCATTFCRPV